MKKFLLVSALIGITLSGFSALAQTEEPATESEISITCLVPNGDADPEVTLQMIVQRQESSDFVAMQLLDKGESTLFFTQLEKGELDRNMAQGSITGLMLQENFASEGGVIRNAGIFILSLESEGKTGSGLFSAKGHVYPLTCTL